MSAIEATFLGSCRHSGEHLPQFFQVNRLCGQFRIVRAPWFQLCSLSVLTCVHRSFQRSDSIVIQSRVHCQKSYVGEHIAEVGLRKKSQRYRSTVRHRVSKSQTTDKVADRHMIWVVESRVGRLIHTFAKESQPLGWKLTIYYAAKDTLQRRSGL